VEEEVGYENKEAGIKLAGTLTFPRSEGPFPAVILITGSGAQDRNETVCGHRPFLVLADHLTRKGMAVLRVDDRGVGGSTGNVIEATSEDLAGDVLVGVNYLKSRKEINAKRIGLIGHSEGGIIAPMAAAQSSDVAFIVLMAGTGLTGAEIICLQSDLMLKAVGASDEVLAMQRTSSEQIFRILEHEKDDAVAEKKVRKVMSDAFAKLSQEEKDAMGASEATIEIQLKMLFSRWYRFFLSYDPKPTLMKVKCPVLAINGELDLQVPPKENLSAIELALKAGGNTSYTIRELPKHNHLFQRAQTGAISEYAKIEETVSPIALESISRKPNGCDQRFSKARNNMVSGWARTVDHGICDAGLDYRVLRRRSLYCSDCLHDHRHRDKHSIDSIHVIFSGVPVMPSQMAQGDIHRTRQVETGHDRGPQRIRGRTSGRQRKDNTKGRRQSGVSRHGLGRRSR
jgi:fermentation-respiration switch protein FrsA (DUF1100 family)